MMSQPSTISMMFEASRRILYLTTSTSGFSALICSSAESTFGTPMRSVVWMTWRWRFETSTTSSSTMPSVPTPAAARQSAVGEPRPPAPASAARRGGGRGGGAETAGAEQQHLGVEQLLLALDADLGQQEVARVALALLGRERLRDVDLVAAVLPQRDAAGHRLDVLVAELLLERVGGERRAVAGRAVEDNALGAVGHRALDAGLEVAAGHVLGAGEVADRVLLGLADVDDRHSVVHELVDLGGVDLLDLLLDAAGVLRSAHAHSGIP